MYILKGMNFKKPPDDIRETFGLSWQDMLKNMGVNDVGNVLSSLGNDLKNSIEGLFQPVREPMEKLGKGFSDIGNSSSNFNIFHFVLRRYR